MRAGPDVLQERDQVLDIFVEAEAAILRRNVARIVPIRNVHIMLRQHGAHGVAQQRREMPGQGSDQQHARLRGLDILLEMQERAERRDQRRLLAHGDLAVADHHAVDAVRRPLMRQPRPRDQLVSCAQAGQMRDMRLAGGAVEHPPDPPRRHAREHADRHHDVAVGLIGLVQHFPLRSRRPPGDGKPQPPQKG